MNFDSGSPVFPLRPNEAKGRGGPKSSPLGAGGGPRGAGRSGRPGVQRAEPFGKEGGAGGR